MRKKKNHKKSFTLIEMMMVMALAGIMLALAVPAFRALTTGSSVGQTTSMLKNALDVARSRAVSSRRYVGAVIDYKAQRAGANDMQAVRLCRIRVNRDSYGKVQSFDIDGWLPDSEWKVFEYGAALLCSGADSGNNCGGTPEKSGASIPDNPGKTTQWKLYKFDSAKLKDWNADTKTESSFPAGTVLCGVVFTPYGSLQEPDTSLAFTVGEAKISGGKFIYENTDEGGKPANVLKLRLNKFTGRTEVLGND